MAKKDILQQNIISALKLEALEDDKKIVLVDKMSEIVQGRLTLRVLEEMSENDRNEFEKILDSSPEGASDFLQKVFPDFLEIVEEEVVKLKQELIKKFNI